jgi:hypothetical protein
MQARHRLLVCRAQAHFGHTAEYCGELGELFSDKTIGAD